MNVTKAQLADLFEVSTRTITTWQSQGMPVVAGEGNGGKGGENTYSTNGYDIQGRIAIVPISGTLVSKSAALRPYSGMTGYNGIVSRVAAAINDPDVDGILLDMDTPGGMVAGGFDAADIIARLRSQKPIWSLANDMNCSAGQLLASACSRRLVTQTAKAGSIGVLMAHSNYAGNLEQAGVDITLIYAGAHKVDGNPWEALPKEVRATFQAKMNAIRQSFAEKVSGYTGISVQAVLDTEAAVYTGQESIDAGLSDELVINTDALAVMREAISNSKVTRSIGGQMSVNQTQTVADTPRREPTAWASRRITPGTVSGNRWDLTGRTLGTSWRS